MYERMLDKGSVPSMAELTAHCGENGALFAQVNRWLSQTYGTAQQIVFPYGARYGWGVAHRRKGKLICNVFAERDGFTVMVRLSDKQFEAVYHQVGSDTQEEIDNRYACGDGGWIHYRVTDGTRYEDLLTLLREKCAT